MGAKYGNPETIRMENDEGDNREDRDKRVNVDDVYGVHITCWVT